MARVSEREKIVLTYEDYLLLPNDRNRYEILEGELHVTPSPSTKHQEVSGKLFVILWQHVKEHNLGKVFAAPMDVILDPTTIVQPDLLFISKKRLKIVTELNIQGAPDLIVEITSPTTTRIDRFTKKQIYARHDVQHYWLIDPAEQKIILYQLRAGQYQQLTEYSGNDIFRPGLFPNLEIALTELWQ